jgi:hypothetical protein
MVDKEQKTDGRGLRAEGRTQRIEDRWQKTDDSIYKPPAGENLKGSTVTTRACFMVQN